ncbi:transposase [bacterium]|nr:transposase [bacterium]
MPQSLVQNIQHIVFSTKGREPFLVDPAIRAELHSYLGGVCRNLHSPPVIVGGYVDHVHVVCRVSKSLPIDRLVRELKVESSKWMKTKGTGLEHFRWQAGYGSFSVSSTHVEILTRYVENQEEHHRSVDFREELLRILRKYELAYDEQYLWD